MTTPYVSLALDHRRVISAPDSDIVQSPLPFKERWVLRGDTKVLEKASRTLDIAVPAPGTMVNSHHVRVTWLSPDEWLVEFENSSNADLAAALEGMHHQLVDVSDYYTGIHYTGPKTRAALAKISTRDLHHDAFPGGAASSLLLGQANAILQCDPDDMNSFVVIVRLSYADYLWCLLADAGIEYGLPSQKPLMGEPLRGLGLTRIS